MSKPSIMEKGCVWEIESVQRKASRLGNREVEHWDQIGEDWDLPQSERASRLVATSNLWEVNGKEELSGQQKF